jgi:hypothetical protein
MINKLIHSKSLVNWILLFILPILLLCVVNTNFFSDLYFARLKTDVTRIPAHYPTNFFEPTVVVDTVTECAGLSIGIKAVPSNFLSRTLTPFDIDNCDVLKTLLKSGNDAEINYIKYSRFWHGYQIISKPIILMGGVDFLKKINLLLLLSSLIVFITIGQRKLGALIFLPIMPFVVYWNTDPIFLLSHNISYFLPLYFMAYVMYCDFNIKRISLIYYGFLCCFFTWLINPILFIAIPMVTHICFLMKQNENRTEIILQRAEFITVLNYAFYPCLGFFSAALVKWLTAAVIDPSLLLEIPNRLLMYSAIDSLSFQQVILRSLFIRFDWLSFCLSIVVFSFILRKYSALYSLSLLSLPLFITLLWPFLMRHHMVHGFSSVSFYGMCVMAVTICALGLNGFVRIIRTINHKHVTN